MSQPVAIICKIKLEEAAYKKFMRTNAYKIAELIIDNRENGEEGDFFYIRKKKDGLYFYLFFNHGNKEWMEQSQYFVPVKSTAEFLSEQSTGYMLLTLDGNSPENPAAAADFFIIEDATFVRSEMSSPLSKEIKKDSRAFFKAAADGQFHDQLDDGAKIVEAPIMRQYHKIREEQRLKIVMQNIDQATPENPVALFNGWTYDGTAVISSYGNRYPEINVREFRPAPYGYRDDRHVIVYPWINGTNVDRILTIDPDKFRIARKGECTSYYVSEDNVYDSHMNPIAGADPATFKVIEEYHARDKNNIYIHYEPIPLVELGEPYTLENHDMLMPEQRLLIGARQVRFWTKIVEGVDAASFEKLPYRFPEFILREMRWGYVRVHLPQVRYGRDKYGDLFIVANMQNIYPNGKELLPDLPELQLNSPVVMRMDKKMFEPVFLELLMKFKEESERLHKIYYCR